MTDKDIVKRIMMYGFWNIYGEFDMVSAMKKALVLIDRGYLFVDDLTNIVKEEAAKKEIQREVSEC